MPDVNAQRVPRLKRLLDQQALLARVARQIGAAEELEPVLRVVLTSMRSLVEFRGGSIGLVDDAGVYIAASDPPASEEVARARVKVGTGLAGRCVADREPVYSPDVTRDPRVDPVLAVTGSNKGMRSYLAVPLVCLGEVTGVLQVDSARPDAFEPDDIRLLEGLATQVAGAIESARRFEEVRRLDDARSMFIARVSHELRTPLTILRGLTTSMTDNPTAFALSPEAAAVLDRIDAAGARLQALSEELITVTTLEAGLLLTNSPIDIRVRDLLEDVRSEAVEPALVTVACSPQLRVTVDATLARQILNLLVQNAITFAGAVEVTATSDRRSVSLRVVDHGPGIPDERKAVVFERFSRGSHTGPGWGLGLSVAAKLAATIGATIDLADTPGGGATFSLILTR